MNAYSKTPEISVLIAAYNAERFIRTTLDSVITQSFSDWELVALDDGSRDSTFEILQEYAAKDRRVRAIRQKNGGASAARNAAYAASNPAAPYVIFLDHDDVWKPDALCCLHSALIAAPQAVGAHAVANHIDASGNDIYSPEETLRSYRRFALRDGKLVRLQDHEPTEFSSLVGTCCIVTTGTVLFRRAALGGRPPVYPPQADLLEWEIWLALARSGPFVFVPKVVLGYRRHSEQVSANSDWMRREIDACLRRLWNHPDNTPEQAALVRTGYRPYQLYLASLKWQFGAQDARKGHLSRAIRQWTAGLRHVANAVRGHP